MLNKDGEQEKKKLTATAIRTSERASKIDCIAKSNRYPLYVITTTIYIHVRFVDDFAESFIK